MKKIIVITIIGLFLGVAVAPSITADVKQQEVKNLQEQRLLELIEGPLVNINLFWLNTKIFFIQSLLCIHSKIFSTCFPSKLCPPFLTSKYLSSLKLYFSMIFLAVFST